MYIVIAFHTEKVTLLPEVGLLAHVCKHVMYLYERSIPLITVNYHLKYKVMNLT